MLREIRLHRICVSNYAQWIPQFYFPTVFLTQSGLETLGKEMFVQKKKNDWAMEQGTIFSENILNAPSHNFFKNYGKMLS